MRKKPRQTELIFRTWGGKRKGAGRKRQGEDTRRDRVPHRRRPVHNGRHPVHVTLRVRKDVPRLRTRRMYAAIRKAFLLGCERFGFRLVHYSVQHNHLHLCCEAKDRRALRRGLQGLSIRLARGLNRACQRRGAVFVARYHARPLRSPREVKGTLCYVLQNFRKHAAELGRKVSRGWVDPYSSAAAFDGWRESWVVRKARAQAERPPPVVPASVWLLTTGHKRAGAISIADVPGSRGRR